MYTVTPLRVLAVLAIYGALFHLIRTHKKSLHREERKTFFVVAGLWAISVFVANHLLYRLGVMSLLPWVANFLHTFAWIGGCLTLLYLAIREKESMVSQFLVFATLSLIVKVGEQQLFGTWELDHFFHVFDGNVAYLLGWSLADGLYPPITFYGLRLLGRRIPGLLVL